MIRLHSQGIEIATELTDWQVTNPSQVHYLTKVLRVGCDDKIELFSQGKGWSARIAAISSKQIDCKIIAPVNHNAESNLHTHIGICLSRGERMDYSVQKAVEMGVSEITPIASQHSQVGKQQAHKRWQRWQAIAVSATEQSGRTQVPSIHQAIDLPTWVEDVQAEAKLLLNESATTPLVAKSKPTNIAILIGPEGGLAEQEIIKARSKGFTPVVLGPRVMRCETAAPAFLAVLQYLWGDLG